MSQNDYIILRDEDGKAYIAHAGLLDNARNAIQGAANSISTTAQQVANKAKGVGHGVRQNHKYILKVFENGKTRYFYKQEEVKAYYEAKKRGVKNAAEYAQNAVKDKASDVADAAKNVVNKATGATANKTAETAKKNADDASRWAKMTERVHKENVSNFKQNPTEANLARAKQSGQAVTRANQNEKNARKEADKAQVSADQHPVNKAKSAFDQAKKSANNTVSNAKNAYERMKDEFKNKSQKTVQAVVDATINKAAYEAPRAAAKVKEAASNLADTAKRKTGITAKEDLEKAERALIQAKRDSAKTEQVRREVTKNGEPDSYGDKWYKTKQEARRAGDAELAAERARNEVTNQENSLKYARSRYEETPLGKAQDMIDKAKASVKETKSNAQGMINQAHTAVKDKSEDLSAKAKSTVQSARDSVKGMIDNARSSTAKAVNEAWDKIPKNADGTVNPFDPKFQSTYNNWKNRKDKYDNSLTGKAKDAAEKATDAVQDMIDKAKDIAGYDERERARQLRSKANAEYERAPTSNEAREAIANATGAETAYNKTPLGMIDKAKKAVKGNSASDFTREQEQTNTGSRQTKRTQEEINEMRNEKSEFEQGYDNFIKTMGEYGEIRDRIARHGLLSAEEVQFNDRLYGLEQDVLAGKITPSEAVRKAEQMEEEAKTLKKVTLHR